MMKEKDDCWSQRLRKRKREPPKKKIPKKKIRTDFPDLKCPITLEPFKKPTFLIHDEFTYEKNMVTAWYKKRNQKVTPMGVPTPMDKAKNGFFKRIMSQNKAVTYRRPHICPITREPMEDPMILMETGETYEHEALNRSIRQTICKGKLLFGNLASVTPKSNKILWLQEHAGQRKAFQMFPLKQYAGFDQKKIEAAKPEALRGAAFSLFHQESTAGSGDVWSGGRHKNRFLKGCHFFGDQNCFKLMLFENCLFERCTFDKCCMCSKFKNCMFRNCLFIDLMEHTPMQVQGSSFVRCRINSKNTLFNMSTYFDTPAPKIHDHHHTDSAETCTMLDELHRCLTFRRAKKIQFSVI